MNEQDKEAFEKWAEPHRKYFSNYHHDIEDDCRDAWQAALEYERGDFRQDELRKQLHHYFNELEHERKRSEKLVEALEMIVKYDRNLTGTCPYGCDTPDIALNAIAEYRKE
jgi:hypothetical protein